MKLRTQFFLAFAVLTVLFLFILGFFVFTEVRVQSLKHQRDLAVSIERQANDLAYLSNNYLLYQEDLQLSRWNAAWASIAGNIGQLQLEHREWAGVALSLKGSVDRLKQVLSDVIETGELGAGGAPKYDPAFLQGSWGRLEVQNRQIVSDAGRLHQILVTEAEQVSRTTTILNICLMGVLALLALANYLLIYRRTSLGLAALERGTEIVGGGDLDFRIPDERRDEIGDLSRAFNRMTAELNGVTASKKDLEKEIMARELVEAERERLLVKEQKLGEELNVVNEELRTQNDELIQHQMVLAAQNADLVEAREEAARLLEKQRDLFLRLQEALLDIPKEFPGVRFGHLYRSATEEAKIGGDFYDVFEAKNGKVGLLIGDVSGHGINAARIASLTKDTIRAFSHQFRRPHLVLRETNRLLIQRNLTGFVTVFLGFLDPESGILVHSSAGHPPPILAADGSATTIESIGSPLGVFPTSRYRDNDTRLDPGSIVVLYTDGITEARRDNLFFGDRGLLEAVLAMSDHSAEELPSLLLERALEFSRGMLADDVALLAVEYEGPTQGSRGA